MSQIVSSQLALAPSDATRIQRLAPRIESRSRRCRRLNPPGCGGQCDDGGDNSRTKFQNIVTDNSDDYCPQLLIIEVRKEAPGVVDNVSYENVSVHGRPDARSWFRGVDAEHGMSNVRIANLRFNDRTAKDAEEAYLTIGPHVTGVQIQ